MTHQIHNVASLDVQRMLTELQGENKRLRKQRDKAREQTKEMREKWEMARSQRTVAMRDARLNALYEVMKLAREHQAPQGLIDAIDTLGKEASL